MKCPFCNLNPKENKVIFETENFLFFFDRKPIVEGHAILISKKHLRSEKEIEGEDIQKEYLDVSKKAYDFMEDAYKKAPLILINAPQDQSVQHFHKHFIPGIFGVLGVDEALRDYLKKRDL